MRASSPSLPVTEVGPILPRLEVTTAEALVDLNENGTGPFTKRLIAFFMRFGK